MRIAAEKFEMPIGNEALMAKLYALQCVRNNTLLEKVHGSGAGLGQAEMRRLMIDVVNCIYTMRVTLTGVGALSELAVPARRPKLSPE